MTWHLIFISSSWRYPVGCHNFIWIGRRAMNKAVILQYVTELQELRDRFDADTYFSMLPIDHCRVNFHEGMDRAVEAVMAVYAEIALDEILGRKARE